jgi:xylulokinase
LSILGIDMGTTGTKAIAFDYDGKILSGNYIEYDTVFVKEGFIEIEPQVVIKSALNVLKKVASEVSKKDPIKAIGISCLGAVVVPIDNNGKYLHNGITFMDSRTVERFEEKTGMDGFEVYSITGIPPNPFFTLSKILWLKENKPGIFNSGATFYSFKELLHIKLGIEPKSDPSIASSTMMFDLNNNNWSDKIFKNIGLGIDRFPEIVESGEIIGEIDQIKANELNLEKGVKVIAGAVDTATCPLGAGVYKPGLVSNTIGTFEEAVTISDKIKIDRDMMEKGIIYSKHLLPNKYLVQGFPTTGGHVLKWFKNQFCELEEDAAEKKEIDPYDIILDKIDVTDTDILFLPHLSGSGTPNIDENSRGAFLKISAGSTKADFTKAIIEGLNFEIKIAIDYFEEEIGKINEIHVTGGAVKSDKWMQIKSDILDKDIISFEVNEAGVLGAAILTAYGTGEYKNIDEAEKNMTRTKKIFKPDKNKSGYYNQKYSSYKKLYDILKEINNS